MLTFINKFATINELHITLPYKEMMTVFLLQKLHNVTMSENISQLYSKI